MRETPYAIPSYFEHEVITLCGSLLTICQYVYRCFVRLLDSLSLLLVYMSENY